MAIEQNSPKAQQQVAVCEKVSTINTSKGAKQVYAMRLEGIPFDVWGSAYFTAKEGDKFRPVVSIVPRGYTDKDGKVRANNQPVVNWEAVK
ncbi:MAG: hypothetical protein LBU89_09415 [Fibromonadaceae bacterium]|jgi:hypothetical protein|nr:hypothetical protein [Fibromonadaceae bacterium]